MAEKLTWLDFFHGGVPAYQFFRMSLDELLKLSAAPKAGYPKALDTTAELCLIGLVAYFEAFCKNQFAAVINICPQTLRRFAEKRHEAAIPVATLADFIRVLNFRIGSIISEQYDFGSAKAVNGLFQDLLNVTPFGKKDVVDFSRLLNDRNLLVHHGGVYTHKYQGRRLEQREISSRSRIYFDSLVVRKDDFERWARWIDQMARKVAQSTHRGLMSFVHNEHIRLTAERKKAAGSLLWFD